ncbi:ABC transporter permease [Actinosynnema sp. NPDC050436]|uniref:ABC transporter permease n=1 Tax=Actinosynnema sp. NPDC050436 TaxID=3155659 RepID=UPI00340A32E6
MRATWRVVGQTFAHGVAEVRATFTARVWFSAWALRMVAQVVFFALIGRMVGQAQDVRYLLVGNVVVLAAVEAVGVINSTVAERHQGTLILLAVSPTSVATVYLARGLQWVCTGVVASTAALLALPSLLGVDLPWSRLPLVVPMIVLTGLSSYAYGCLLSTLILHNVHLQWLVLNVAYLILMAFAGVNVPASYWPEPLAGATHLLPVTNGLLAVRAWLDGATGDVLVHLVAECAVGSGWFLAALLAHRAFLRRSRADGSLDFV